MNWRSPTPRESALTQIDDWVRHHQLTPQEEFAIRYYYGTKRAYGLRCLRIESAVKIIRDLGERTIDLRPINSRIHR